MSNAIANVSLFYTFFCQPTLQIASNLLDERHKEQWSELQEVITKQYVSAFSQNLALSLTNLLPSLHSQSYTYRRWKDTPPITKMQKIWSENMMNFALQLQTDSDAEMKNAVTQFYYITGVDY